MKQVSLSGSPRENVGRKGASELRNSERVPGVMYGGKKQVHFSVSEIDLLKVIQQPDTLMINLEVGGTTYPSLVKDVQYHPVTDRMLHIDLIELIPGKPVTTALPVKTTGTSEGVRSGGKLVQNYRKMRVVAAMENLPDRVEVDITKMQIGDMVRVRDINYPGVTFLEPEASVVVAVQVTRAAAAEATPAAGGAPAAGAAAPAAAPAKK